MDSQAVIRNNTDPVYPLPNYPKLTFYKTGVHYHIQDSDIDIVKTQTIPRSQASLLLDFYHTITLFPYRPLFNPWQPLFCYPFS